MDTFSESKYRGRDPEVGKLESERRYKFFVEVIKSDFMNYCKQHSLDCYPIVEGSVAKGMSHENSDIDLVVVQSKFLDTTDLQNKLMPWVGKWLWKRDAELPKHVVQIGYVWWIPENYLKEVIELGIDKIIFDEDIIESLKQEIANRKNRK